jgi:AcrR family transcriptional regulator
MARNASGNVLVSDKRIPRRGARRRSSLTVVTDTSRSKMGDRRDLIVSVSATLFCESGFHETTVRQIADKVGILSGSIYHHFEAKEDIFTEIIGNYVSERRRVIVAASLENAGLHNAISSMCTAHIIHVVSNSTIATIMANEARMIDRCPRYRFVREAESEIVAAWRAVLQSAVHTGKLHSDIDCGLVIGAVMTLMNNALSYLGDADGSRNAPPSANLDHIIDQILTIVFGIISPWLKS